MEGPNTKPNQSKKRLQRVQVESNPDLQKHGPAANMSCRVPTGSVQSMRRFHWPLSRLGFVALWNTLIMTTLLLAIITDLYLS